MVDIARPGLSRTNAMQQGRTVTLLNQVDVPRRPIAHLNPIIGDKRYDHLLATAARFGALLGDRTIWNINSTAVGGGVAEMLQALVGYSEDLGIPLRWAVITGDTPFFGITKRLHNQVHGAESGGPFSREDVDDYQRIMDANAVELLEKVRPGDLVLLHDPQTAGLSAPLVAHGATVVWRCHIGVDWRNDATDEAWAFLRPHVASAHGFVFSRREYVPSWVPAELVHIIPPSIDPFSPKNQDLDDATVRAILATIGVLDAPAPAEPGRFTRYDGSPSTVTRPATVVCERLPGVDDTVTLQVSRWDRLKDMDGVMRSFAEHVVPHHDGFLMLVGPAVGDVTDDPEGAEVYRECVRRWRELPAAARSRILLVTLALDDIEENAATVNALQRHATIITQKSIAEGFGLTVAEGMWKSRPVIGSAVGGIIDQIPDGAGILLPDPHDLSAFASQVRRLLDDPDETKRMGLAATAFVRERYVGDLHLLRYARLFETLISGR
jgi:trehalose synthase